MQNRLQWFGGIDVGKAMLDIRIRDSAAKRIATAQFANTAEGHGKMIRWLKKHSKSTKKMRLVLEATGNYSLDLALALQAAGLEIMVANPRAARKFADAQMQRSSTDATMALALCEFAARMEFTPWQPPSLAVRQLRDISRRIAALTVEKTRERNRLHAGAACRDTSEVVRKDLLLNISHLEARITELERHALALIVEDPELGRAYKHVVSATGFAATSTIQLLPEIKVLPPDMTIRQWIAHCGLDVRHVQSGSSVHKVPRISKQGNAHIRRALYMPALVAIRHDPHVRAFYEQLLARGKARLQAIVAVMRKLLHCIFGMIKTDTDFDGAKFRLIPDEA
jgi:transposase